MTSKKALYCFVQIQIDPKTEKEILEAMDEHTSQKAWGL